MVNILYRCEDKTYIKSKNRSYRCKNSFYIILNDKKLCWCHYNKLCKNNILIIQKIYRGYRCRRFVKIYKLLPDDVQFSIYLKINNNYYYKKHCDSIYKILHKRYLSMHDLIYNNNTTTSFNYINNLSISKFIQLFDDSIYPTYNLYNKYFDIVLTTNNTHMLKDIQSLHILSSVIIIKIKKICQYFFYEYYNNSIDNVIYNKMTQSISLLNMLSEKYERLIY